MKKPELSFLDTVPLEVDSSLNETQPNLTRESVNHDLDCDFPSTSELQSAVHTQLRNLGFVKNGNGYVIEGQLTKQRIRDFHSKKRIELLRQNRDFIERHGPGLVMNFANGEEINPELINPELIEVKSESKNSLLFRFACLLWSVPVSQGFGRRLRFLVRDRQNGRLIGLFAIGDPVFNLSARDKWIGWTFEDRKYRLVHVMDAYVVGAVPPYAQIIGGKLIAALMGSKEVKAVYERKYLGRQAIISKKEHKARLALITTTSAMGRSSLYNRLIIPDGPRFIRIGETRGFGHFHLSGEIFEQMRSYLEALGHPYATGNRFGMGPNWKIRVARTALDAIGLDSDDILNHGIAREVYAVPLARNWQEILLGKQKVFHSCVLPASRIVQYCLKRWILPRASRDERYRTFDRSNLIDHLLNGGFGATW